MHRKSSPPKKALFISLPIIIIILSGCRYFSDTKRGKISSVSNTILNRSFNLRPNEIQANGRCHENPEISNKILDLGHKIGVKVIIGKPQLAGKDGTYKAFYGRLGVVTLSPRPMSLQRRCELISHEYIHVLQHLNANLKGMKPLGWPISKKALNHYGSAIEAEAYSHQNGVEKVLVLLNRAKIQLKQ